LLVIAAPFTSRYESGKNAVRIELLTEFTTGLKKQKAGKAAFEQTIIILYFTAQFNRWDRT
jgi:hypothetical protein